MCVWALRRESVCVRSSGINHVEMHSLQTMYIPSMRLFTLSCRLSSAKRGVPAYCSRFSKYTPGRKPRGGLPQGDDAGKTAGIGYSIEALISRPRLHQALRTTRKFCTEYGARGRDIVKFEWVNFKRLLQTDHADRWRPRRMQDLPKNETIPLLTIGFFTKRPFRTLQGTPGCFELVLPHVRFSC